MAWATQPAGSRHVCGVVQLANVGVHTTTKSDSI